MSGIRHQAGHESPTGQIPGAWAVAIVGAFTVMAGLGFGRFSYTMLLPSTRTGLHLSYISAGFLGTANLAGYLAGSLMSGATMRQLGPRLTGFMGLLGLVLALAWMGAAHGVFDAALARALAGACGAIVYVQALGLIAAWFTTRMRGVASGIMHSGNGGGLVLTGLGLPFVLSYEQPSSWRVSWEILAAATLLILPLAWAYLKYPDDRGSARPAGSTPSPSASDRPSVMQYGILYALFGLSYVIYATFFAEILRENGLSLRQTGVVWAGIGALSLGSGPLAGALSDRIGRMTGLAVLFGLQAVAYVTLLNGNFWSLIVSGVFFGTTAWGIPAIMAAAMSDIGRAEDAVAAFGRITAIMGIGQAAGPLLGGSLADVTGIVNSGLWISTTAAAIGVVWSVFTSHHLRHARES